MERILSNSEAIRKALDPKVQRLEQTLSHNRQVVGICLPYILAISRSPRQTITGNWFEMVSRRHWEKYGSLQPVDWFMYVQLDYRGGVHGIPHPWFNAEIISILGYRTVLLYRSPTGHFPADPPLFIALSSLRVDDAKVASKTRARWCI